MANRFVETIRLVAGTADRGNFRVALIGGFALPFLGVVRATGDVDFLAEASGESLLHRAFTIAKMTCLNRTPDVSNYRATDLSHAPVDVLWARRPAALAMLDRASPVDVPGSSLRVPVADAEAIIGLKVQAIANDPRRRDRDRDDIRQLVARHRSDLDLPLVRSYFRLFDMESELDEILGDEDAS